ncbi:MAG TPA: hypothetical protein VD846_01510 [Allosphingosinicella sp.]|nr:hypothetical protein [Allosphingosinicella sp.]
MFMDSGLRRNDGATGDDEAAGWDPTFARLREAPATPGAAG